jgi:hypothetical protein
LERYKTVLAMLSDPVNYAIAQREVLKNRKSIITPPIPRDGGFVFVRAMDWPCYDEEELDIVAEVFETPEGWTVFFEGKESDPVPSSKKAIEKAKSKIEKRGHIVIEEIPWDPEFSG